MKKILALFSFIAMIYSVNASVDPFCVANHGSSLLKDKEWHVLSYVSALGESQHMANIAFRQYGDVVSTTTDGVGTYNYEFKSKSSDVMKDFYKVLTESGIKNIFMEKDKKIYLGQFTSDKFVSLLDNDTKFIGLDVCL